MVIAPYPRLPGGILAAVLLLTCTVQLGAVTSAFVCNANAGVPPIVRADGITELMGDLILNCVGGNPTPAGVPVPLSNVQIFVNANVTSRIVGTGSLSEATLIIDEALTPPAAQVPDRIVFVPLGTPPQQVLCTPQGSPCPIVGDGLGTPYETIPGTPTVYSGRQLSVNSVAWLGVPIDQSGDSTRVIRITNVRANASQLGSSSTLVPTQIVMFITISGTAVTINNPQQTVAFNEPSLVVGGTPGTGLRCVSQNMPLTSPNFNITVKEGFASSFRRRNLVLTTDTVTPPVLRAQNIPGYPYNAESGFYNPALFTATPQVGLADYGTRIRITFNGIPAGAGVFVPLQVPLIDVFTTLPSVPRQPPTPIRPGITQGRMVLIQTDEFGADLSAGAGYSAVTAVAGTSGGVPVGAISPSTTPGQGYAVYEVVNSDVNALEIATIPVSVAFTSTAGIGEITTNVSLAPAGGPLASIQTGDLNAPIPRFGDNSSPQNAFSIGDCSAPTITSPANGSTLPGSSVNFQWTTGTGVTQYWLTISKVGVGGAELFNADPGPGLVTSKTINGLPTDGSTIYVSLYSHIGNNWTPVNYTYTAAGGAPAAITSPANGSTLPGSSVNFQWTNGIGVTQYWFTISKVGVGGAELFNADPGPGLVTSKTINGLPTDGSTIYVSLYSHIGSAWIARNYTYTSAGPAVITSPMNGSMLPGSSVNFQWANGIGVTQYWLTISKVGAGGAELFNADPGPGLVTSKTINGLPTDGSTIYVSLYSHIGSNWIPTNYTYTAAGPATITSPVIGSTLPGSSVTFQWTTGTGVTQYWFTISKVGVGGAELFNADPGPGLVTSKTINGLPTDGSTIYVSLYSHIGSAWTPRNYTYTAFH